MEELKFLSAGEAEEFLGKFDKEPGVMDIKLGQWIIWPLIRHILFRKGFLKENYELHKKTNNVKEYKFDQRLKRSLFLIINSIFFIRNIFTWGYLHKDKKYAFISNTKHMVLPNGKYVDPIYGELLFSNEFKNKALYIPIDDKIFTRDTLQLEYYRLKIWEQFIYLILNKYNKDIKNTAYDIINLINRLKINIFGTNDYTTVYSSLLNFEAKRIVFKWFLKRLNISVLIFYYGLGKMPYIAAAKELGIETIEIQHGIFGPNEPGFKWNKSSVPYKNNMPIPGKIFLYGDNWKRMLEEDGFWSAGEVFSVGSAMIDFYRNQNDKIKYRNAISEFNIIFPTQWIIRNESLIFLETFLNLISEKSIDWIKLGIKIHPNEQKYCKHYEDLINKYSQICHRLQDDISALELIAKSDFCVGYISTCLIESVGLGIPAISICGKYEKEGFAGYYNIFDIKRVMPHITSPNQLIDILTDYKKDVERYKSLRNSTKVYGRKLFKERFISNTTNILNNI